MMPKIEEKLEKSRLKAYNYFRSMSIEMKDFVWICRSTNY